MRVLCVVCGFEVGLDFVHVCGGRTLILID